MHHPIILELYITNLPGLLRHIDIYSHRTTKIATTTDSL